MTLNSKEAKKLKDYLQTKLGCHHLTIALPKKAGQPAELCLKNGEMMESIGTIYRDAEDGDVSFAISLTVLEEDLK
ncbi:hypothetical protein COMNV_00834 [Commensalibacter sp. Nvir]|uniref:DUF3126 family protein n=1 Tax=Commensalibacter sp. Nvir TaxID=3069817 RepID=UPI002D4E1921|nr:hypothetical protein COMNV_00834 [Commensalibacter sp. Nvir]